MGLSKVLSLLPKWNKMRGRGKGGRKWGCEDLLLLEMRGWFSVKKRGWPIQPRPSDHVTIFAYLLRTHLHICRVSQIGTWLSAIFERCFGYVAWFLRTCQRLVSMTRQIESSSIRLASNWFRFRSIWFRSVHFGWRWRWVGLIRFSLIWFGLVWFGLVWFGFGLFWLGSGQIDFG